METVRNIWGVLSRRVYGKERQFHSETELNSVMLEK